MAAIEERRRKVAALTLRHVDQIDIARQLGVDRTTVNRDVAALRAEWRTEAATDVAERMAIELAELDQMERDAAVQFAQQQSVEWLSARLAIKKRRADLLGLDAPKRTELTGKDGGPIDISGHPEWVILRGVIFDALVPFPEARTALTDTLLMLEAAAEPRNGGH